MTLLILTTIPMLHFYVLIKFSHRSLQSSVQVGQLFVVPSKLAIMSLIPSTLASIPPSLSSAVNSVRPGALLVLLESSCFVISSINHDKYHYHMCYEDVVDDDCMVIV